MLDNLKHARFKLGNDTRVVFETDSAANPVKIGDFAIEANPANSGSWIRLGGAQYDTVEKTVLKVSAAWHEYETSKVQNAGTLKTGRKPNWSNVQWQTAGFVLRVR